MSNASRPSDSAGPRPTRNEWLSDRRVEEGRATPTPEEQDESATEAFAQEEAGIAAKE